jgi:hypothetical protein
MNALAHQSALSDPLETKVFDMHFLQMFWSLNTLAHCGTIYRLTNLMILYRLRGPLMLLPPQPQLGRFPT